MHNENTDRPSNSSNEITAAIGRLEKRLGEVKDFKPEEIHDERDAQIHGLSTRIQQTLDDTLLKLQGDWRNFRDASALDPNKASRQIRIIGSRLNGDYDYDSNSSEFIIDLQKSLQTGKSITIELLQSAITIFQEHLIDLETEFNSNIPSKGIFINSKVFIVHGHDSEAQQKMARFIERIGLDPVILNEQTNQGRTIIEKFENHANQAEFAIVLLTPDDIGGIAHATEHSRRARQNVIFELGYFAGKLGRKKTCLVQKGSIEIPSDLYGVIYIDMDEAGGWKLKLVKELKEAGLQADANKL